MNTNIKLPIPLVPDSTTLYGDRRIRYEDERKKWIEAHGSEHLRLAWKLGVDVHGADLLYAEERLQIEHPAWCLDKPEWTHKIARHPGLAALRTLDARLAFHGASGVLTGDVHGVAYSPDPRMYWIPEISALCIVEDYLGGDYRYVDCNGREHSVADVGRHMIVLVVEERPRPSDDADHA